MTFWVGRKEISFNSLNRVGAYLYVVRNLKILLMLNNDQLNMGDVDEILRLDNLYYSVV